MTDEIAVGENICKCPNCGAAVDAKKIKSRKYIAMRIDEFKRLKRLDDNVNKKITELNNDIIKFKQENPYLFDAPGELLLKLLESLDK